MEGITFPENARYWIENIDDEEKWLMYVATYPRGAEHAKAIDLSEPSGSRIKLARTE